MSTTGFWGEADNEFKIRHAEGGPLYEIGAKIWSEFERMDGRLVQSWGEL